MSDENKIGLQTDPNDINNIERLIKAIDKLDGSLQHLANASRGMNDLQNAMKTMQATMVTGFTEMSIAAKKSDDAIVSSRTKSNEKLLAEQVAFETKQQGSANKFHDKRLNDEIKAANDLAAATAQSFQKDLAARADAYAKQSRMEQDQQVKLRTLREQQNQGAGAEWEKFLATEAVAKAKQLAMEQDQQIKIRVIREKANQEAGSDWEKFLATEAAAKSRQREMEQAQQVAIRTIREKENQAAGKQWEEFLALDAAAKAKQLAMERTHQAKLEALAASSAEKQRILNTSFVTSSLPTQISTAERAAVYGSMGGNAAERFGSSAAAADLAALRAQYALLPAAQRGATDSTHLHNDAMREGHALARGLSGSLGALWLTYGSLVPLAAGAAIGASLKNIVEAGKEVEYQLKFIEALGNAPVKMEDFLRVTDGTVVSIKEAAGGMRALAQNGLDAVQSLQALPTILNLAVIGEMSVGAAALSATGVVSAFGLQLGDIARVGDVFAQAAASSNTSVALMTESMKQASTVASIYHVSLEETAGALGQLAKINITGSAAGTAFTNMLTGLYSPTNQAQKALAQLKVTTDDGQGGLKNSTVLLGELRQALSKYSEQAQTVFLNDIFTTRGTKAASQLLTNLDEYKSRIQDAANSTGFMSAAVAKLEDTTEGAFRQLKNSIGDSLNQAFASSSPILQNLISELAQVARSEGAVSTLTGLADAALRLTTTLVDHAAVIATVAAGYLTLRIGASLAAAATAQATATTTAGFLATSAAATTLASRLALVVASLGWISLAVTAAIVVWDLFISKTTDVEKADQKLRNSINTNIEFIERETKALEERNKAWNPDTQKFDLKPESQSNGAALTNYQAAQNALQNLGPMKGLGDNDWVARRDKAVQNLADAQRALWKETAMQESLAEGLSEERTRKEKAQTLDQIAALVRKGETEKTVAGQVVQMDALGNEKSRAIALSAKSIQDQVLAGTLSTKQAQIELTAKTQEYNAALQGKPVKEDRKAASDSLKAKLEELKLNKELLAVQQRTTEMEQQAANKAGTLGDLGLLEAQNKAAKEKVQVSIETARASMAEVEGIANKKAAAQKFANQEAVGAEQIKQLDLQLAISKGDMFRRMEDDQIKFQAKTLADNGQYVAAYLMEYTANYGPTIKRVEQDLTTVVGIENYNRLQSYLDYLKGVKEAGLTQAIGKSEKENFEKDLAELQAKLSNLANLSGPDAGLGAVFTNAFSAMDEYGQKIETLRQQQAAMQSLANDNKGSPKLQQDATAELQKLNNLAEQMRAQWVSVGQSIGNSLSTAFGKGGTALGGLINATVAFEAQKDRIEQNRQQADDKDPTKALENQAIAAKQLESAQLGAYTKMAGAAKGYFKENTVGYQVASNAEKAFTVIQLAEAARMFVVKSGYLMGLLGIQVASQAEAAAAEGAYTLSSIAMAGARAAASGIAAAVSAMVGWPFPLNIIALGATIAAVGALGVKIAGGGGSSGVSSAQRQETNGTGTNPDGTLNGGGILGDTKAKSESIAKSLEAIDKTSGLGLAHTISMDKSLKTLVTNIAGLASLLVQGTNLTSPIAKDSLGGQQNLFNKVLGNQSIGEKLSGGLLGKIVGGIFGGAKSVTDVGLKINSGSVAALSQAGGVSASQYTDILKKGGLFSSDKNTTDYKSLGPEINDQFSKIFKGLYDTVVAGANTLGLGGSEFEKKLQGFVINIGEISTKDMTGEEIEKALQTAFSKLGDDMAKFGVDGLQQFQKVGEGYLETLARVANDFLQVNDVLAVLGKSFNVTGMAAIVLSESLIDAAGGLETLTENTGYFVENFLTQAEQMAPVIKSVDAAFAALHTSVPTSIDAFKNLVLSQDLNTKAGQDMFAALIAIAPQFKTISDYAAEMAGTIVKSAADIRNERKSLQDQLDSLTMSPAQLDAKERAQVAPANLDLYDQVKALTDAAADAKDRLSLLAQIYAITGDKAGAAAVLEEQHQQALIGMSVSTAALTKELWAAQAAQAAAKEASDNLSLLGQIYAATGNKAGAAAVLEQQHQAALVGMAASTAALTKELWAAQAAAAVVSAQDNLLSAYNSQKSALEAVIDTAKKFRQSMLDLRDSLQAGDLSTLSPEQKLAAAKSKYEDLLTRAKSGDKDAQSQVGAAAQDFLTADRAYNASNSVYAADAMKVQRDLKALADSAGREEDIAQQQLDALTKQVSSLITINDSLTIGFNKVQQAVLDLAAALKATGQSGAADNATSGVVKSLYSSILGRDGEQSGIDYWTDKLNSGTSLPDVIKGFTGSKEKLGNDVESLYKSVLGRSADADGKEFWIKALQSGTSIADATKMFYSSPEYLASHGGAHAYGGVMGNGFAMVGEKGPEVVQVGTTSRVYSASQSAGMFAPNTAGSDETNRRMAVLEEEARADKAQRAIIAEAAARDQALLRAKVDRLTAATRSANAGTRKNK